jgi:hypothetical protein
MKWLKEYKSKAAIPPPPMNWVQVSGNTMADALYVISLSDLSARRREMRRLKFHHGQRYVDQLERVVVQLWPHRATHNAARVVCNSMDEFDSLMTRLQAGQ